MFSWKDKIVWIVGASSGIGAEMTRQLAVQRSRLIITSRNEEKLRALHADLPEAQDHVQILPADVEQTERMEALVAQALELFGSLDVLILNAGITQRSKVADTELAVYERLINVNFLGLAAITHALLPHFRQRGGGRIAVTSSVAGKIGTPLRSGYGAAKHALHGFYESLRAEEYDRGLRITIVCPGFIQTDISRHALNGRGDPYDRSDTAQTNGIPVDRCVRQYLQAVAAGRSEIVIAGAKERLAIFMKRLFPGLLRRMMRKIKVT